MSVAVGLGSEDETSQRSNKPSMGSLEQILGLLAARRAQLRERITMDTLRPLPLFLGIVGPSFCFSAGAFTPPSRHLDRTAWEKIEGRISLNTAYFASNYAVVCLGVCLVVALSHPWMLVWLTFVYGLWTGHDIIEKEKIPIVLFDRDLGIIFTAPRRSLCLTAITIVVVIWKCLVPLFSVIFISTVLILSHAILRDPRHIESSRAFPHGIDSDSDDEEEGHFDEVLVERPGS